MEGIQERMAQQIRKTYDESFIGHDFLVFEPKGAK
jgi:hypothetical protein